jgi:CRISPR-associated endonuclease/helicase Cas3
MGGEETEDWDVHPEAAAVLIGTQDMLLSRALNRGYGMSRYRWPMHFGLLHSDCLWVFDEIQLMGSGLATTTQLEAFRATAGGNRCHSWWMSATLDPTWLETVDFSERVKSLAENKIKLENADLKSKELREGYEARKPLERTRSFMGDCAELAKEIIEAHKNTKGRTLVVVNTVKRARELHDAVERALKKDKVRPVSLLIHSQFRPPDRKNQMDLLLAEPSDQGTVVISTQVVEAGVDVSARTLFTEIAPWSSLVQRLGRCNRRRLAEWYYGTTRSRSWCEREQGRASIAALLVDQELIARSDTREGHTRERHTLLGRLPIQIDARGAEIEAHRALLSVGDEQILLPQNRVAIVIR